MDNWKLNRKDKIFESLIKDLHPITVNSKEKNFGTASTAKGATNHTLEFDYKGFRVKVELK